MKIRRNSCKRELMPALVFILILFSITTLSVSGNNESFTIKGNQHYVFVLGVLDSDNTITWYINTSGVSLGLYIAEISQYKQFSADRAWEPIYENASRTLHNHQFTIPSLANWTLVLENTNTEDALVTFEINIPISIPSFTIFPVIFGLSLILILRKKRGVKK